MHEVQKLDEAAYFLGQMAAHLQDRATFQFDLSALLAAARSVLQYGLLEAQSKSGGQAWYDSYVTARPILTFFKDKRDVSIHRYPVRPSMHVAVTVTERAMVSDSVSVTVTHPDGRIVEPGQDVVDSAPPRAAACSEQSQVDSGSVEYRYRFADWPSDDDVVALCRLYVAELHAFVVAGQARRYLSDSDAA